MNVLLLGGTGMTGRVVLQRLRDRQFCSSLQVASRSAPKAEKLVEEFGDRPIPVTLNTSDNAGLRKAYEGVDLVINTAATVETAVECIRAAIDTGTNYVDITAEAEVFRQAEVFHEDARAAGVRIVVGAGVHPGATEFIAAEAARHLDQVESVDIFILHNLRQYGKTEDMLSLAASGWPGSAGLQTMWTLVGRAGWAVMHGKRYEAQPADAPINRHHPSGTQVPVLPFASLEPLSLNRAKPELTNISVWQCNWPPSTTLATAGLAQEYVAGHASAADIITAQFTALTADDPADLTPIYWAEAHGKKNGSEAAFWAYPDDPWGNAEQILNATAAVAVYTAEEIAKGNIEQTGVLTPIDLFEADEMFCALSENRNNTVVVKPIR